MQNHIGTEIIAATHTTPDAIQLNALLHKMVEAGCTHVFMEVSSHAIHHYALVRIICSMQNKPVPEFFGFAPATITHINKTA